MKADAVRSVIDSSFALADAQKAYARSRSGRARGKIVINFALDAGEAGVT